MKPDTSLLIKMKFSDLLVQSIPLTVAVQNQAREHACYSSISYAQNNYFTFTGRRNASDNDPKM